MIYIVLINYNQSQYTIHCVESVIQAIPDRKQILLIDNGSRAEEYQILRDTFSTVANMQILRIPDNIGYVRAVNKGLTAAFSDNADYAVIMNNDTVIEPSALLELQKTCALYNDRAIVSGKVLHYDDPQRIQYVGTYFSNRALLTEERYHRDEIDIGQCDMMEERDMIDDILWMIPKVVYEEVGLYDESFFLYSEQADYALRAVSKGFKLVYSPQVKVWHKGSLTTGDSVRYSPKVLFWRSQGSVIYRFKHMKTHLFLYSLVRLMLKNLLQQASSIIRSRKLNASSSAVLRGTFSGLGIMLFKKVNNGYNPFLSK